MDFNYLKKRNSQPCASSFHNDALTKWLIENAHMVVEQLTLVLLPDTRPVAGEIMNSLRVNKVCQICNIREGNKKKNLA